MKKRKVLSLFLTLTMAFGLFATPAAALDENGNPTIEEFRSHFSLEDNIPCTYVETPLRLGRYDFSEDEEYFYSYGERSHGYFSFEEWSGYNVLPKGGTLTITNTAQDINCILSLSMSCYDNLVYDEPEPNPTPTVPLNSHANAGSAGGGRTGDPKVRLPEGTYLPFDYWGRVLLEDNSWGSEMENHSVDPPFPVELNPGESFTFDFHNIYDDGYGLGTVEPDTIFYLTVRGLYPDQDYTCWVSYLFSMDKTADGATSSTEPEGQVTSDGVKVLFRDQDWTTDVGAWYEINFTNTTDQPVQGNYGLLTYTSYGSAQIMFFDLDIAPGESKTIEQNSWFYMGLDTQMIWIRFDSAEERNQFENSVPCDDKMRQAYHDYNYYPLDGKDLQDIFGIDIQSK